MKVEVDLTETSPILIRAEAPKEMLSVTKNERGQTVVRINSSSLGVIQECMRKARYTLHDKWRAEDENPATLFGSAIHKALEVFYAGNPTERKLPSLVDMELMSYGHAVAGEHQDLLLKATRAFIQKAEPLKALPETNKRSIQTGVWLLWHYFQAYLNDPYVAYIDEKGPFVERNVSFVLHENEHLRVEYFGTIDLIVRHTGTGELLVCDHKTSSVVGNDFYNRLKPNHQYTGYLLAARESCGVNTKSFLVNCLQVKERPKTARGIAPHLPRQVTTRDEADFEEFKDSVMDAVRSYLGAINTRTWPIGHVNACTTYGGCQYLAICAAPRQMRDNILAAKFVRGVTP